MLLDLLAEWPSGFSFCEREERKGFENSAYNSIQKKQRDQKAEKQLLSTKSDLEKVFLIPLEPSIAILSVLNNLPHFKRWNTPTREENNTLLEIQQNDCSNWTVFMQNIFQLVNSSLKHRGEMSVILFIGQLWVGILTQYVSHYDTYLVNCNTIRMQLQSNWKCARTNRTKQLIRLLYIGPLWHYWLWDCLSDEQMQM